MKGKKILIGITAGIAAYKAAELVRLFIKSGAEVKVVMTPDAVQFVTPLTLATLSKNPVVSEFVSGNEGEWNNHVAYGLWADVMLIAPCTANTLSKMVSGMSDNFLLATFLSVRCPVVVAPAMDDDMWKHESTQKNIQTLSERGNKIIEPAHGELASGLIGQGRMQEPSFIFDFIQNHFEEKLLLKNIEVLISAGPTYENIDPVRFIGNRSSGKMGFALAETFAEMGAKVTLVCGPVTLKTEHHNISRIDVESADAMYDACVNASIDKDIIVMTAAVADYKPSTVASEKIKKKDAALQIDLQPTKDILKTLGQNKTTKQIVVGFALETENEMDNASKKLSSKNIDMIVLNSLKYSGAGFGTDTNKITIIDRLNTTKKFDLKTKQEVAVDIVDHIINLRKTL